MVKIAKSLAAAAMIATMSACTTPPPAPPPAAAPGTSGTPAKLLTWPDLLARPKPAPDKSFRYGADPYQVADLWLPAAKGPHPVVLMVHGGCWTTSIADRTLMNYLAGDLRGRGYAVWNIDYRGVDRPGGGYPGTFLDAAAAADLLRSAAREHPLDLGRVVAVGHSAGGHLTLWLAARPRLPAASPLRTGVPLRVRNVISLGGLPDLEQAAAPPGSGCGTEVIDKLVGPPTFSSRDVYADTSIPRLAPLGVRQWLVNGDTDRIIPNDFATDYAAKMRTAGDEVSVEFISATGHVELVAPGSKAWSHTLGLIAEATTRRPRR